MFGLLSPVPENKCVSDSEAAQEAGGWTGDFLKVFVSPLVKTMVIQGGVAITKYTRRGRGVSVIYERTNEPEQWTLQPDVRRVS